MRNENQGLAYVIKIVNTEPIPHKDRIVFAINNKNNLKAAVSKADLEKDDLFVFFEVDTLIPDNYTGEKEAYNDFFSFLSNTKKQNTSYYHIHARKMDNCVSMGLIVPLNEIIKSEDVYKSIRKKFEVSGEMDLTQYFELKKFEPVLPMKKSSCISFYNDLYHGEKTFEDIPAINYPILLTDKSDEENLYNVSEEDFKAHLDDMCFPSIKVDGMSTTFYIKDGTYYILGHNQISYVPQLYQCEAALSYNIFDKMKKYEEDTGRKLLVCGEFEGPKIQGNPYKIELPFGSPIYTAYGFYCYKLVSYIDETDRYVMGYEEMKAVCEQYDINMVKPAWEVCTLRDFVKSFGGIENPDSEPYENIVNVIQDKVEKMSFDIAVADGGFDECTYDGNGGSHEGIVVTSFKGHSDSMNVENSGWSFKVKSHRYQVEH